MRPPIIFVVVFFRLISVKRVKYCFGLVANSPNLKINKLKNNFKCNSDQICWQKITFSSLVHQNRKVLGV